jgi:hypothetical protein
MIYVRGLIAAVMVLLGAIVLVEMLRYPIAQTFSGVILGLAMMGLGLFRLNSILRNSRGGSR